MINTTMTSSQPAGFGMSESGRVRVSAVSTLPVTTGAVSAAVAGPKSALIDATPVCGYRLLTDGTVFVGAFPGTSAWSPPI